MIEVKNGPELWTTLLAAVRDAFGSGIVAGGAVRDFLLEIDPRDIDIFVDAKDCEALHRGLTTLRSDFRFDDFDVMYDDTSEYESNPDWVNEVTGVLAGTFAGLDVQIIGRPMDIFTGANLVARFDLGITRSWFDGAISSAPEADLDRKNKTLTLMRHDTKEHIDASKRRAKRFCDRVAGYTFVDPKAPKKIIGIDNFGRESVSDFLVCENVANDYVGKIMVAALNDKLGGEHANTFFELVPAERKLWGGMAELI